MEKLILRCGRYVPPTVADAETRVRLLERYLARLSEELEHMVGELEAAGSPAAEAIALDGEGGGV